MTEVLCFEGILKTYFNFFLKCAFSGRICVLDCYLELVSIQISNYCVVVHLKLKIKSLFESLVGYVWKRKIGQLNSNSDTNNVQTYAF